MRLSERNDSYATITDQIIAALDAGTIPWQKPWKSVLPQSIRGHVYRGINLLILALQPYADPRWVTFNTAKSLGGSVRKGEHGTVIQFWQFLEREAKGKESTTIPLLRTYRVFNVEQCDLPAIKPLFAEHLSVDPNDLAEAVIAKLPWTLTIRTGNAAFWNPADPDAVTMPRAETFKSMDAFYSTLFHEVAHASGHPSRLNRDQAGHFGDERYSFEELVAQFTAAFVCAHVGIDSTTGSDAAYIRGWADVLRNDRRMIVKAAGLAQRAADFILGTRFAEEEAAA